jgi:hypothetical protein
MQPAASHRSKRRIHFGQFLSPVVLKRIDCQQAHDQCNQVAAGVVPVPAQPSLVDPMSRCATPEFTNLTVWVLVILRLETARTQPPQPFGNVMGNFEPTGEIDVF